MTKLKNVSSSGLDTICFSITRPDETPHNVCSRGFKYLSHHRLKLSREPTKQEMSASFSAGHWKAGESDESIVLDFEQLISHSILYDSWESSIDSVSLFTKHYFIFNKT